jgi:hypothetical protein
MASGHLVELPAVGELLERVDPRGLEQAVLRVGIRDLDDDQRLRRQVRHDVCYLRRVEVVGRDDGAGRLKVKLPAKTARRRRTVCSIAGAARNSSRESPATSAGAGAPCGGPP